MVFGPAVALVSSYVPSFTTVGRLRFDELTGPGYFVYIFSLVIFALYTFFFGGEDIADSGNSEESAPLLLASTNAVENGASVRAMDRDEYGNMTGATVGEAVNDKPCQASSLKMALAVCNIAFFTHFYGFALQETITTPLVQSYYGWSLFFANLLFTAAGAASLLAFVTIGLLSMLEKPPQDRTIAATSLAIGFLGFVLLLSTPEKPLSVPRFLSGFVFISIAFPLGRASVVSLYTKILPAAWQGTGQGVILAVGALARILGPFWAVRAFDFYYGGLIVFGATSLLFAATLGLLGVTYETMRVAPSKSVPCKEADNAL
jgi:hypothetical protein